MTLVLDNTAKPIGLTREPEAVSRVARSMLEGTQTVQPMLSDPERSYRSQYLEIPAPIIVMAQGYVEIPDVDLNRVHRRAVFARDRYQCQYCGMIADSGHSRKQLTMDHVKPVHLFPHRTLATNWENVTTACLACNQRKAGKLPRECGMMPRSTPRIPHYAQLRFAGRINPQQRDYINDYFGWQPDEIVL